ncbi:MAG: PAS domain S-box protein, partial [Mongoliibacter sp.]|uniref:PAS domain S-box protein n=1 Tax=Mongoliibacter sp. TaxID=2022438 RepID=UPI0012F26E7C
MSEERLDSLLIENLIDNLQEVFFLFNQKGKMILWNNKVNQVTGYNNAEIIKLRPLDFFPKEEQKKINQKIETAFKTGKASIDANILSKEGELFPHLFTASFTYYKNEPCLYGVGLDIGDLQQKVFEINLMLNNTDEAFVILDKSFRIISFNQKFEENYFHLYGKHVSKLDNFLDLAKEKHREKLTLMYEKVLQGEFVTTESKILSPEGKLLIYDFTHKPAKNKSGETLGIFISAIDVTEKRKAQKKIRKSEERFKTMMKEGSDLIVILDNEGNYKFVSPNHLYYLGYSEGELMSTSSFSLIHPDDLDRIKDTFKLILVQKRVTAHPYRVKHKDSSWRWMQSTATNLFKDPTIGGIVINSTDVTDLVSIQKKLEANYELYNYIQKASNEAIFEWDIRTDIFTWGESFERIFGHDFDNKVFKLKDWIALVHPLDAEKEKNRWNLFLADKEQVKWTNEFRFLDSKGVYFFVEEVAYLVRDDSGEPIRMIGSIRDISHQKKETIKNKLLSDIGYFFKNEEKTILALEKSLEYLSDMCDCNFAEIWMVSKDRLSLQLYSNLESSEELRRFYISTKTQRKFNFGEGLPGKVWKTKQALNLEAKQIENEFIRAEGIKHLKLGMLSTIPLFYNGEVVAILMLGSKNSGKQEFYYKMYLKSLEHFLGAEIIRKQQQEELNQLFDNAPDILAVADASGHFRKVNPAFCQLLGYTAEEITSRPFFEFLHPEDLNTTNKEYRETVSGLRKADNFLNRYRCKSGEYKWISWKSSEIFGEEGLVYAFGRDVTERIE